MSVPLFALFLGIVWFLIGVVIVSLLDWIDSRK